MAVMRRLRAGFTFWQIAAVLAVFLAVVAVLFPVFQKARHADRQGRCPSNLKQLGLAYAQYLQDNDGEYPPSVSAAGSGWAGKIYSYIKATDVYKCPNDTAEGQHISYAQNLALTGQPLTILTSPVHTAALYEFTTLNCDPSTPETVSATGLAAPQDSTRYDPQTLALNFLAADGHVKFLKPAQVSSGPGALPTRRITRNRPALLTFAIR